jgi:hypothetical protein
LLSPSFGVRASQAIYGVQVPSSADVVIADSHPMDQDLRQGSKALANTSSLVYQIARRLD